MAPPPDESQAMQQLRRDLATAKMANESLVFQLAESRSKEAAPVDDYVSLASVVPADGLRTYESLRLACRDGLIRAKRVRSRWYPSASSAAEYLRLLGEK